MGDGQEKLGITIGTSQANTIHIILCFQNCHKACSIAATSLLVCDVFLYDHPNCYIGNQAAISNQFNLLGHQETVKASEWEVLVIQHNALFLANEWTANSTGKFSSLTNIEKFRFVSWIIVYRPQISPIQR